MTDLSEEVKENNYECIYQYFYSLSKEDLIEKCKYYNFTYSKLKKNELASSLCDFFAEYVNDLSECNKDILAEYSRIYQIKGVSKLKNCDLVERLYEHIKKENEEEDEEDDEEEEEVKEDEKYKKKNIPKCVKTIVWNTYIGEMIPVHLCICCKRSKIKNTDFHVGHVMSEKNGGTLEINNLRPICASCNYSMGSTNMIEFVKKYGYYI
jgi:5-methylcytosine-specific restriction endonuclease McrA